MFVDEPDQMEVSFIRHDQILRKFLVISCEFLYSDRFLESKFIILEFQLLNKLYLEWKKNVEGVEKELCREVRDIPSYPDLL